MKLSIVNWFINSELGIYPGRLLRAPARLWFWLYDLVSFKKLIPKGYGLIVMPSIHDKFEESGSINNEYFWQDLLCSQYLYDNRSLIHHSHYDIGSRIDGFINSMATFTTTTVLDIRPQTSAYRNIKFEQLDITGNLGDKYLESANTISCLHTLEHIGLGRYGDVLSNDSWKLAILNMSKMLKSGDSRLILSTLCGKPTIYFNSHRVFRLDELLNEFMNCGLHIAEAAINNRSEQWKFSEWDDSQKEIISRSDYNLVVFVLHKNS